MKEHMSNVNGIRKYGYVHEASLAQKTLKRHINQIHLHYYKDQNMCCICGKPFVQKQSLNNHQEQCQKIKMKKNNAKIRTVCKYCGKMFPSIFHIKMS